jgi:hypothetical protein
MGAVGRLLAVSRKLKLIDLGGAADLRIGINYLPRDFLLDPRFCAPERFIMSTRTPVAPPRPIAALLSPVLWQLNRPDKCVLVCSAPAPCCYTLASACARLKSCTDVSAFSQC